MNSAIILAGGDGIRMEENTPKQFIEINNKMILEYSVEEFINNKNIDEVVIVCHENWHTVIESKFNQEIRVVKGGETRSLSSYYGLQRCNSKCKKVLIHDAARPLVNQKIIDDNIRNLNKHDAVIPVISNNDSLINSQTMEYIDRSLIKNIQTPQGFKYHTILTAYLDWRTQLQTPYITPKVFKNSFKDDFSLLLNYSTNLNYHLYNGDQSNFKITNKEDIDKVKFLLKC